MALERPDSEELIRSNANMERLRFITWPAHSKWNPDGLPIGFVMDKDAESGEAHFGFTCAACHNGLIEYEGKRFLVEGGPAHSDFDLLISEIGESMQKTLDDNEKFSRFGGRVLGVNAESSSVAGLRRKLESKTALLAERIRINHPPHPNGYGRLDAFGVDLHRELIRVLH